MPLGYRDPDTGELVRASSVKLALIVRTDPDERRRKAAFEGLRSIESFVLEHGFLDIVRMRNRLGRLLGYEDYYDWRVNVVERMTKRRLFAILDDLAVATRAEPGNEVFVVHLARDEADVVLGYEAFRDDDALAAHRATDAVRIAQDRLGDVLADAPTITYAV